MQSATFKRDTASFAGDVLPSVMNEDAFWPSEPRTLQEAGITEMLLESLITQQLLNLGTLSGRNISERTGLTFTIIELGLVALRMRQLVAHARPAPLNDFYYSLTENGQRRALSLQKVCSYSGPAPVPLMDYVLSVEAQARHFEPITEDKLIAALEGVTYDPMWLNLLGPAVNSTSGIFLYGSPGNGKTTLAKCLTACRGEEIWIPHAIIDDGSIIKLFDASYHIPSAGQASSAKIVANREHDRRWIRVRRPTVIVGGELTLDNLEVRYDPRSNVSEAPLQMKSNCGCLLIDDFGRQRVAPADLLNRWIVPLESHIDYLTLPSGKKISVPFEQTILFSTNLQPESLVDEAFLRRVPFKIEIGDPTRSEYIELFRRACHALSIQWRPEVIDEFMERHYRSKGRALRRCHPRDLLAQVVALSAYYSERVELRMEFLDLACNNYFGLQSPALNRMATATNGGRQSNPPTRPPQVATGPMTAKLSHPIDSPLLQPMTSQPMTSQPMTRTSATIPVNVDAAKLPSTRTQIPTLLSPTNPGLDGTLNPMTTNT